MYVGMQIMACHEWIITLVLSIECRFHIEVNPLGLVESAEYQRTQEKKVYLTGRQW